MRRRLRPLAAALALAAAFSVAPRAEAHEHRWHLGGSLGFSQLFGGPTSAGVSAGAHVAYELTDIFNLMGAVNTSVYPYGQWAVVSTGLGVGYVVDTSHFTPYVGALAGPAGLFNTSPACGASIVTPCHAFRLGAEILFGLDYQLTRRLAVGVAGRYQILLLGSLPWMTLSIGGKVEYAWGG